MSGSYRARKSRWLIPLAVLALGVYWLVDLRSSLDAPWFDPLGFGVFLETAGCVVAMTGGLVGLIVTAARRAGEMAEEAAGSGRGGVAAGPEDDPDPRG